MDLHIRPYHSSDQEAVIALWHACGLIVPHNDPVKDIARKQADSPDLFLVATQQDQIIGCVMVGYDGHRGWINYLAVSPDLQRGGVGKRLVEECETRLLALGCPKINLQIRSTNHAVIAFYERLGFKDDHVISMGKRLIPDIAQDASQ